MATKHGTLLMFFLLLAFEEMIIMRGEAALCEAPSQIFTGLCFSSGNCGSICEKEGFTYGRCKIFKCVCDKDCGTGGAGRPTGGGEGPPAGGSAGEGGGDEGPPGGGSGDEGPPAGGDEGPPAGGGEGGEEPPSDGPSFAPPPRKGGPGVAPAPTKGGAGGGRKRPPVLDYDFY